MADLKTARWGRPSVGTIGGKITGLECFDDEEACDGGGDTIGKIKQQLSLSSSPTMTKEGTCELRAEGKE